MTNELEELDAWLAENVMPWEWSDRVCGYVPKGARPVTLDMVRFKKNWHPTTDANDMREMLEQVPEENRIDVRSRLAAIGQDERSYSWFLLTADPLVVCRAVREVMER